MYFNYIYIYKLDSMRFFFLERRFLPGFECFREFTDAEVPSNSLFCCSLDWKGRRLLVYVLTGLHFGWNYFENSFNTGNTLSQIMMVKLWIFCIFLLQNKNTIGVKSLKNFQILCSFWRSRAAAAVFVTWEVVCFFSKKNKVGRKLFCSSSTNIIRFVVK